MKFSLNSVVARHAVRESSRCSRLHFCHKLAQMYRRQTHFLGHLILHSLQDKPMTILAGVHNRGLARRSVAGEAPCALQLQLPELSSATGQVFVNRHLLKLPASPWRFLVLQSEGEDCRCLLCVRSSQTSNPKKNDRIGRVQKSSP